MSSRDAEPDRGELERQADVSRSRLMDTLDALDHRRHDLMDVGVQIRKHVLPIGIAAGVALLAVVGGVALIGWRYSARDTRRSSNRARALQRVWQHPELVAQPKRSLLAEAGRTVLVGTLTFLGAQLAKRALTHSVLAGNLPKRLPDNIPAIPRAPGIPGPGIPATHGTPGVRGIPGKEDGSSG